jgi:hypothetical protein
LKKNKEKFFLFKKSFVKKAFKFEKIPEGFEAEIFKMIFFKKLFVFMKCRTKEKKVIFKILG